MTLSDWYPGLTSVLTATGLMLWSGTILRRLLLGSWRGAPALLADFVLAISLITVLAEALGIVGLLSRSGLLIGSILITVSALLAKKSLATGTFGPMRSASVRGGAPAEALVAVGALLVVAFQWTTPTLTSLEAGMYGGDTLWYHMPFSAHFAQTGSITGLQFVDTQYLNWFYPQNSELVHSIALVLAGSDFFSPVINFLWLGLGALSGWCIGRPWRSALPASLGVTLLMSMEVISSRQPGNANNDAMTVTLLLASIAVAVTAWKLRNPSGSQDAARFFPVDAMPALVVSSLALGLAVGTKLTALAPGLVLLVAWIVLLERNLRIRWGLILAVTSFLTGGFWFLRNLFVTGNPLPWISLGPLEKAGELAGREPKPVIDYVAELTVWSEWLAPGLADRLGPFWLTLMIAALGGICLAVISRNRVRVAIGLAGLAGLVAYLLIPLGAAGPEGAPTAFSVNVRYVAPVLAIGFVLLGLPPRKTSGDTWRIGVSWFFALALVITLIEERGLSLQAYPAWKLLVAFAILAVLPIAAAFFSIRGRVIPVAILAAVWLSALVVAGSIQNDRYLEYRYSKTSPRYPQRTYPWIELDLGIGALNQRARSLKGNRIGLSGSLAQYYQYGVWGLDVSNDVEAVGVSNGAGDIRPPRSCEEWVSALNEGAFDLVVTSPPVPDRDPVSINTAEDFGWISPRSATPIVRVRRVTLWALDKRALDPDRCQAS